MKKSWGFELDRRSYLKGMIEKWLTPCNTEGGIIDYVWGDVIFRGY